VRAHGSQKNWSRNGSVQAGGVTRVSQKLFGSSLQTGPFEIG
jgi:hypothetical protein